MARATKKSKSKGKTKKTVRFDEGDVFARVDDVFFRKNIDGTATILRFNDDHCFFTVDGISADFFSYIDGRTSVKGIMKKLEQSHVGAFIAYDAQFKRFVGDIFKENLIRKK